jgi:MFS family permease
VSVSGGAKPFRLRSIALSVYLPTFLFAVGQGAVVPIIPLFARDLGASVALAGVIVAVRGVGTMVFDVPAGVMVARLGERGAMLVGTAGLALVALGAGLSRSPIIFAALMFVMGCGWSIWLLGRLSYATDVSPLEQRGRVLSLMGGVTRVGNFVGPFLGGLVADQFGLEAAFYTQAVLVTAAAASMFFFVKDEGRPVHVHGESAYGRLAGVVRDNRSVFATAGVATVAIQVLRAPAGDHPAVGDHLRSTQRGRRTSADLGARYDPFYPSDRDGPARAQWAGVRLLGMSLG